MKEKEGRYHMTGGWGGGGGGGEGTDRVANRSEIRI